MHAKQRNEAIRHVVAYVFTIAMVFLAVTPFIYVVLTALKQRSRYMIHRRLYRHISHLIISDRCCFSRIS